MPDATAPATVTAEPTREGERLDNFVDGAFAFAVTLLVISGGKLPQDVAALGHALRGVPAFAACFAQLALFWHGHVRWRDTVRGIDGTSLRWSLLLVFFALIFVFPLHLVYAAFFNGLSGGALSPEFPVASVGLPELVGLFACYGLSYALMAGTLAHLFGHGARRLARTDAAWLTAEVNRRMWRFFAVIGLVSTLLALSALVMPGGWPIAISGFSYALLGFTGVLADRWRRRLQATP